MLVPMFSGHKAVDLRDFSGPSGEGHVPNGQGTWPVAHRLDFVNLRLTDWHL